MSDDDVSPEDQKSQKSQEEQEQQEQQKQDSSIDEPTQLHELFEEPEATRLERAISPYSYELGDEDVPPPRPPIAEPPGLEDGKKPSIVAPWITVGLLCVLLGIAMGYLLFSDSSDDSPVETTSTTVAITSTTESTTTTTEPTTTTTLATTTTRPSTTTTRVTSSTTSSTTSTTTSSSTTTSTTTTIAP